MRILRAGCFERVSTEEQSKFGYSIQTQKDALVEYCTTNKMKIVDHYCDDGVSAGISYKKRPEMVRLLEDIKAGKIDIVLFTRLDRWFRNVKEYFKVQEILDDHNVQWKAIWEDYDTSTSNGRMAITIFLAIAQNEREKTSERIKVVFENKLQKGETFLGDNAIPYGYIPKRDETGARKLVKDPDTEEIVQTFWDMVIKYNSVDKAGRHVNLTYGVNRSRPLWHKMSKNEIYTGVYRGKEDYCEPYISEDDWCKFMGRPKIKRAQQNRIYLFTGLMKCPKCGHRLSSFYKLRTLASGKKTEHQGYRCVNKHVRTCEYGSAIFQNTLERWLLENIEEFVRGEIARVEIAKAQPKPKVKSDISKLKEQLRRLEVVYMAGNKSDAEYIAEQNELKALIAKYSEEEGDDSVSEKDTSYLQEFLETDFRSIYESFDLEDKRRFWRTLIKEIKIEGNRAVSVEFN